jgi:hypothetical protein
MPDQLAASPKLNQRLNRPVEETLSRLRSGMLLKELGAQAPEREKPPAEKPMEMAPPVM